MSNPVAQAIRSKSNSLLSLVTRPVGVNLETPSKTTFTSGLCQHLKHISAV